MIGALLLILLVIAVVSWRIGPAGVASEPREEHLEEQKERADDERDEDHKDRDRRGRSEGRERD